MSSDLQPVEVTVRLGGGDEITRAVVIDDPEAAIRPGGARDPGRLSGTCTHSSGGAWYLLGRFTRYRR
jgi:hypothetical protein